VNKFVFALGLMAAAALVPACSSEDSTPATTATAAATVTVKSNQFDPPTVTVKVGDTVRFTWGGGTHNVVSGTNCTSDGKFTSGAVQSSGSYDQKFTEAGTFEYFCTPHCSMGMTGKVVVTP
jgi:plastocyanin